MAEFDLIQSNIQKFVVEGKAYTDLYDLDTDLYNQILELGITITMNLESMYYGTFYTRIADIDEEIIDSISKRINKL